MKPIVILYATRQGHTRRIAGQVAAGLQKRGLKAQAADVRELPDTFDLKTYCGVVLAASVHAGRHEREMIQFAKKHRKDLQAMPNAFLSVTLSEAGAERKNATEQEHARFVCEVQTMIERFVSDTEWQPEHVVPVAGALRYSHYNFFVRLLMKGVARRAGGSTDTSHDHDYTDWVALDEFVDRFAGELKGRLSAGTG
jgi:menaquinone-dependent protoporphyrinogen oxidase